MDERGKCPCYVVMAPEYGEGQRVCLWCMTTCGLPRALYHWVSTHCIGVMLGFICLHCIQGLECVKLLIISYDVRLFQN